MVTSNIAVFLDRDGIINVPIKIDNKPKAPLKYEHFQFTKNIKQMINNLKSFEVEIIVITNQPELSNNELSYSELNKMHLRIHNELGIKNIYICPHILEDNCNCKKPKNGMLIEASKDLNIDLENSIMIGDRWSDVASGNSTKTKCIFVDYNYDEKIPTGVFTSVSNVQEAFNLVMGDLSNVEK